MKILVVIPYFMPATSYGGPVKVAYDLARSLARRGHRVTVATTDVFDDKARVAQRTETMEGISVVRFRNVSNRLAKRCNGYTPFLFIPWLWKHGGEFDAIYCHDFFTMQTIAVSIFSRLSKVPFIVQPHGCLSPVRREARFSAVKRLFTAIFGTILTGARHIVALTAEERNGIVLLKRDIAEKIAVVPNGLDLAEIQVPERIDLHRKYGLPSGSIVIGFIGRLAYIKGIDISLEVLASLKKTVNFSFLVMGPDEGVLDELKMETHRLGISDRVVFTGIVNGAEKMQAVASCDLCLFTSRDEGLPMTVLEVAALGVPQVLSAECNVPEVAEHGAGYVHPVSDIAALARCVAELAAAPEKRAEMGKRARAMVETLFSLDSQTARVEALLAGDPRPQPRDL
ncbi:glycosyltransferase family 4 protein [Geomonas sp. RF6]|uniref:glycosyltransferase family 4 protein n=1 Tax=Geomonas sp. RF6 TaxID=2897342 RepID=UPI001E402B5A|nr:glycosyltransferase family 4 protein [Geomonas sp. RF6]UFS71049.1 glycosyltransferase family 4 protein [Geomonas sp. RF6]